MLPKPRAPAVRCPTALPGLRPQALDPHHLRFMRALGRKVSDEFAVPLCRRHHRAAHRSGSSSPGGRPPASIRSRSPASSGSNRAAMSVISLRPIDGRNRTPAIANRRRSAAVCSSNWQASAELVSYRYRQRSRTLRSMATGKPGPFAAPASGPGCGRRYYAATGEGPSGAAVTSALDQIEAQTQFDGPERAVHVRGLEIRTPSCRIMSANINKMGFARRPWPLVEQRPWSS